MIKSNTPNHKSTAKGFTLLELMITMAIAGILASVAVPNFITLSKNTRITSTINEFAASSYLARSEAIKRGRNVQMCKKKVSDNECSNVEAESWSQGWIIYEIDSGELIYIYEELENSLSLTGNGGVKSTLTFKATGELIEGTGSIWLCDDRRDSDYGKGLSFISTGRFRITKDEEMASWSCS